MGSAASSTSARSGGSEGPPHSTESDGSPPPPSTDSVSVPRNAIILGDDFLQRFGAGSGEPLRGEESRDSRSARPGASAKSPPPPPRDGASKSPATAQCGGGVEEDESYLLRPPPRPSFWMPFLAAPISQPPPRDSAENEASFASSSSRHRPANERLAELREERRRRTEELTAQIEAFEAFAEAQRGDLNENNAAGDSPAAGPCAEQQAAVRACFKRAQQGADLATVCRGAVESLHLCMQPLREAEKLRSSS